MCAVHCIEAVLDGVEIHGAQGHLIQQFVSPFSNRRNDDWGGTFEKRLRFPQEIIRRVRTRVGARAIVGYRMGVEEFTEGGLSIDDTVKVAQALCEDGSIDYLSLAQGNFNSIETHLPDRHSPILAYRDLHARFKAVANGAPVVASTRIQHPDQVADMIADGEADMIGLCRALLADPDWPNKAKAGRSDTIRRCIACNQCWAWIAGGEPIACATNPVTGREYRWKKLEQDRAETAKTVAIIGGGPGGLYTAILAKKAFPGAEIDVYERNALGDTFGWGVVFSDETLGNVEAADPESFGRIQDSFAYWTDIETFVGDELVRSTGHGFCGLARKRLLELLDERAREVGVGLHYETEVERAELARTADLVVASDGINSAVREAAPEAFGPSLDWRKCRFTWLGTNKPLSAFTFVFRENEHGVWNIHAYPFERGDAPLSTWIVECTEETWRNAGLEEADEEATVAYVADLFSDHLAGYELLTNRSIWRVFPTVRCERWLHGRTVLVGDSAHTAHFSIGSGTKLAMEDSIALVDALESARSAGGTVDVPSALRAYQDARHVEVIKTQKAAQISLEWFEHSARYLEQDATLFTFNLMTRSKRSRLPPSPWTW